MDKSQAIHTFWSSFGIPAYDSNTVPSANFTPSTPYITYDVTIGALDSPVTLTASVWHRDSSWSAISKKVDEIARKLKEYGFYKLKIDGGYVWATQGTPFAQRMSDPEDDMMRRYYLIVDAEFLTAY